MLVHNNPFDFKVMLSNHQTGQPLLPHNMIDYITETDEQKYVIY